MNNRRRAYRINKSRLKRIKRFKIFKAKKKPIQIIGTLVFSGFNKEGVEVCFELKCVEFHVTLRDRKELKREADLFN